MEAETTITPARVEPARATTTIVHGAQTAGWLNWWRNDRGELLIGLQLHQASNMTPAELGELGELLARAAAAPPEF